MDSIFLHVFSSRRVPVSLKRLALLLFLTVGCARAAALGWCYDDYPGICCNCLEVDADILWMRPCLCDQLYAIEDPNLPETFTGDSLPLGTQLAVRPLERLAYRIAIARLWCNRSRDFTVQYSAFQTNRTEVSVPECGGVIWPAQGHPFGLNLPLWDGSELVPPGLAAEVIAFTRLDYHAVEAGLGMRERTLCQHLYIRLASGIHFAYIDHSQRSSYQGFSEFTLIGPGSLEATAKNSNTVWGIGPRVTIEGRIRLPHRFGVSVRLATSMLAGSAKARFTQEERLFSPGADGPAQQASMDVHFDLPTRVFPAIEGRTGFFWALASHDCFYLDVELGIEWDSYVNALARPIFNHTAGTSRMSCYSFGMRGIFLSFRIMS